MMSLLSAVGRFGDGHKTSYPTWFPAAVLPMKKKPVIRDRTRMLAAALWVSHPEMKPVGPERQAKHLADLDAVLDLVSETDVIEMIRALRADKFRRDWVASFARIAEELPRIRTAMADVKQARPLSSVTQEWMRNHPEHR